MEKEEPKRVLLVGLGPTAERALLSLARKLTVVGVIRSSADPDHDPVFLATRTLNVPVIATATTESIAAAVEVLQPDCVVVSSFDRILPPELLARCRFVNVHYALLPRYRGRANVNWAIINGERETGITIHVMAPGLDAGELLYQAVEPIGPDDDVGAVYERLNRRQEEVLGGVVEAMLAGKGGHPQMEAAATYGCTRLPDDGLIDWSATSRSIHNLIRGSTPPYPGAFTYYQGERLTVWRAAVVPDPQIYEGRVCGRVLRVSKAQGYVDVLTGDGVLRLIEVQCGDAARTPAAQVIRSIRSTLGVRVPDLMRRIVALEQRVVQLEQSHGAARRANRPRPRARVLSTSRRSRVMSRIDVVIPCYNYGRFLRECVESVLNQREIDSRVLVIDDCSSDETETIARRLARDDPRVEFRRHSANCGHIATYNEGLLAWATADYCMMLSADDLLLRGSLHRAITLLDAHPEMSFCHGSAIHADRSIPLNALPGNSAPAERLSGEAFIRLLCSTGVNKVETPTAFVRTSIQHRAGGYDPELPHAGDLEMWLRLASFGDVGRIATPQALYRVHGQNMSVQCFAGIGDLRQRWAAFDSFFLKRGAGLQRVGALREAAARQIAMTAFWNASERFDAGDQTACDEFLELAFNIWPPLAFTREWRRFKVRRLIGRRGAAMVRFVRDQLSGHGEAGGTVSLAPAR